MIVAGALAAHRSLAEPWKQWLEPLLDIGVKSVSRFPNSYMSNEREGVQKILPAIRITSHANSARRGNCVSSEHFHRGEKSEVIVFWKFLDVEDKETGEHKEMPFLRYFHVFNVEQTEGIKYPQVGEEKPREGHPIDEAEAIISAGTAK